VRIAVVSLLYAPDGGPSAPLYRDLCERLAARGHDVTVIAAVPHYPTGRVPPEWQGRRARAREEGGVRVLRVPVPSVDRSRLPARLFQFAVFQVRAALAARRLDADVALVGNPALEVFLPFVALATLKRVPTVFSVHDVYPDVGIGLGIFRRRAVSAAVRRLEAYCVRRSAGVRILSPSFAEPMRRLGAGEGMRLIYDWVGEDRFVSPSRCNAFALEHKLTDRFVLLYAGNLGLSQGLEHVLGAAERLTADPDLLVVLVGDGAARESLERRVRNNGPGNVVFIPFQPAERVPEVLAAADVCLVPLRRGLGRGSLPSKTLSILAAGRPVLASVDKDSDVAELVRRSGAGVCVTPEDSGALASAIVSLKRDSQERERMAAAGRSFAATHHRVGPAVDAFERMLLDAAGPRA
jgi:colanic acid biosynthesis glycosyl transferase WcaI